MTKKILLLFSLALIFCSYFVEATGEDNKDITEYESLVINLTIEGNVQLSALSKLSAELFLLPKDSKEQKILLLSAFANPAASIKEKENSIVYSWGSVGSAKFGLDALIKTQVTFPSSAEIPFPPNIKENLEYTKASENIDSNNKAIIEKANEIVAGKTDTLEALFALANFVNSNVEYDESYAESVKKASWVLQNKKGVCDEYTILFMALCRALGIPTRYISGVAYSNIKKDFGNHAWAEIWLPGHDWIPFDVTYGQYGWVDASHVALAKTIDTQTSVIYTYTGSVEIGKREITVKTSIANKLDKLKPKAEMEIRLLKDKVKAGSYVPLEVTLKNLQEHYLPLSIYLTKGPGVVGKNVKQILLKPEQAKRTFFILHTPADVEERFSYETTIEIKTSDNNKAITLLLYSKAYEEGFSLEKAESIVEALTAEEEEYSYDVVFECQSTRPEFYIDEEIKAICNITNKGNVLLRNLKLCVKQDCKEFDLPIGAKESKEFILGNETDNIAKLENELISKSAYIGVNILQRPDLKIVGIDPKEISYTQNVVSVTIETKSLCKNAVVKLNNVQFEVGEINLREVLSLSFSGKYALSEKIKIKARCYDLRAREYKDEKEFDVQVRDVPFYAKIWQSVIKLFVRIF